MTVQGVTASCVQFEHIPSLRRMKQAAECVQNEHTKPAPRIENGRLDVQAARTAVWLAASALNVSWRSSAGIPAVTSCAASLNSLLSQSEALLIIFDATRLAEAWDECCGAGRFIEMAITLKARQCRIRPSARQPPHRLRQRSRRPALPRGSRLLPWPFPGATRLTSRPWLPARLP